MKKLVSALVNFQERCPKRAVCSAGLLATTLFVSSTMTVAGDLQELEINGRTIVLPGSTPTLVDDQPGVLSDLIGQLPGLQLRWEPDPARGALPTLVFSYTLIGPVTRSSPLEILGQAVTITGDTLREGFTEPGQLVVGAPMIIAGLVDPNGSLYATQAVRRGAQGNKYLLSGYVQQLSASEPRVRIGQQWINATGVSFADCATALPTVGDYLELRADSVPNFQPGDPITTVVSARCTSPVPLGTPGAVGLLEGIITAPGVQSFRLGAIEVVHDATTVFEFGGPDDLDAGMSLSVEGTFVDIDTLAADLIEFVRPAVRFEAPLRPADVTPGISIRPFGVTVLTSAQLRDEDGILATGLIAQQQVQVRGWLDREGVAFATRVRERGNFDPANVDLRAPVDTFTAPRMSMQGLTVDTTNASFVDIDGQPSNATAFFAALQINQVVDVSGALWTEATRTLSGGVITPLGFEHTQPVPVPAGAVVAGTVSNFGVALPLFSDGFE